MKSLRPVDDRIMRRIVVAMAPVLGSTAVGIQSGQAVAKRWASRQRRKRRPM